MRGLTVRNAFGATVTVALRDCHGLGIGPFSVFFYKRNKSGVGFGLGDVVLDAGLADVEIDLPRGATDVAEIGVGHLAGAVYDAAHDGELHALEVTGLGADALGGRLQIEERA